MYCTIKDGKIAKRFESAPTYIDANGVLQTMGVANSIYTLTEQPFPDYDKEREKVERDVVISDNNVSIVYNVIEKTIDEVRQEKLMRLQIERDNKEAEGFEYNGSWFHFNEGRQAGFMLAVTSGAYSDSTFIWDDVNGQTVSMPTDEFMDWYNTGVAALLSIALSKSAHEAAINALQSIDEVVLYDITI